MREMVAVSICLLIFLVSLQSGLLKTGIDYEVLKKTKENLQAANEQLANEIKNLSGNSLTAHGAIPFYPAGNPSPKVRQMTNELKEVFEQEIKQGNLSVEDLPTGFRITFINRFLFSGASAQINPTAPKILARVGQKLSLLPEIEIQIYGHSCFKAPLTSAAKKISPRDQAFQRASVIADYLEKNAKIHSDQIFVASYGYARPLYPNDTEFHKNQNDRTEMIITSIDETVLKRSRELLGTDNNIPVIPETKNHQVQESLTPEALGEEALQGEDHNAFDAGYEKPKE